MKDIPAGGVILGQQPQRPLPTKTTVDFHTSLIGIYVMLDENNICKGYKIQILDQIFNREYNFDIDNQQVWDDITKEISSFPRIGEVPVGIREAPEYDGNGDVGTRVEVQPESQDD